MSEIVVAESTEVVLHTGEVILLSDLPACARAVEEIRDLEYRLRQMKNELTRPFVEETEKRGSKTLRWGEDLEVVVSASETVEWDVTELAKLQDAGLPDDRYDELVKAEVTYKVSAREATRIAGANEQYAEIIERAKTLVPKNPTLKISRAH